MGRGKCKEKKNKDRQTDHLEARMNLAELKTRQGQRQSQRHLYVSSFPLTSSKQKIPTIHSVMSTAHKILIEEDCGDSLTFMVTVSGRESRVVISSLGNWFIKGLECQL